MRANRRQNEVMWIFYNIPESEVKQCTQIINNFCFFYELKTENVAINLSIAEDCRIGKHGEKKRQI